MLMTRKSIISALCHTGALALTTLAIMALLACPGKHKNYDDDDEEEETEEVEGHSALSKIDDDVLNSFNPKTPYEQHGHSRPFKIHPRKGITISAEAGAFDEDVRMIVNDVPMSQLNQTDKELQRDSIGLLLAAWDISAGLPHDSIIPGKYTVSFDLDELDIPEEAAPYLRVCRHRADGSRQIMNTRIENGSIVCDANQNSVFEVIVVLAAVYYYGSHFAKLNTAFRQFYDAGIWPWNYWKGQDGVFFHEEDEFGSFDVCFRYSMTEYGDRTREYLKKRQELEERVKIAEGEAYNVLYERWPDHRAGLFETPQELRQHNTYYVKALTIAMAEDDRLMELAKDPMLKPQSVQDIITGIKMALRYIRTELKMKPLSEQFTVYLSPSVDALGQEAFRVKVPMVNPYVVFNYESYVKPGRSYVRSHKSDCMMVTLAHETMHVYQTDYVKCSLLKDSRYFEAMGSWVEHHYANWLWKQGYIDYDPEEDSMMKTGFSGREHKELLAHPLNSFYPGSFGMGTIDANTEGGYMLGDLLQWMLDHVGKRDANQMMEGYTFDKGFAKSVMDVWGLSESQFDDCFKGFCETHMKEIAEQQAQFGKNWRNTTDPIIHDVTHSPGNPVVRITDFGNQNPLTVKTVHFVGDSSALIKPYTLFAVPSEDFSSLGSLSKFSFTEGDSLHYTADPYYVAPCKNNQHVVDVYAAYLTLCFPYTTTGYIDIVALYQPIFAPEVKGRSRDGSGIIVRPNETPDEKLLSKGYVTGMQVGILNNKTQQIKTYRNTVADWKEQFVAPFNQIGVTDPDDIDLTLQTRWYYETPDGRRYYSPPGEKVHYEFWRSHEEQHEERNDTTTIITDEEQEGSDDMGDVLIDTEVRILREQAYPPQDPFFGFFYDNDDTNIIKGRLKVKNDQFQLTVPAHGSNNKVSGYTISGKCLWKKKVQGSALTTYDVEYLTGTVSMSSEVTAEEALVTRSDNTIEKKRTVRIRQGAAVDGQKRLFNLTIRSDGHHWSDIELLIPCHFNITIQDMYSGSTENNEYNADFYVNALFLNKSALPTSF